MTSRIDELLHPISQMTTYELRDLRKSLQERLAMPTMPLYSRSREELQQDLAEVVAEQDERARIRHSKTDA